MLTSTRQEEPTDADPQLGGTELAAGRPGGWRATLGWPLAVVVGIVLVNLPALVHAVDVNPLDNFAGLTRVLTGGFLPGGFAKDADVGWTAQALGHLAALDWLHGHVPWWNPFEGLGTPLAAEMQSAAFFPPVILMALADGSLYFHLTLEVAAGLATWFLIREIGLSRPIATVGGLLFGLSGTFSWMWHAPMNPVPLLPLALLGVERAFRRPESSSGFVILTVALALSFYGGFPEATYADTLLVVVWAVFRLAMARGGRRRLAGWYAAAGATGLLLTLPLALPFGSYLSGAYTTHAGSVGYYHLVSINLPLIGLPYLYGPLGVGAVTPALGQFQGEAGGYVTAGVLVLGLLGVLRRGTGLRYLLAGACAVTVLWAFGVEPFAKLTALLPYASHVETEVYADPIWELAAILLACFGLDALGRDRRARLAALGAGIVVLGYGALLLTGTPGRVATAADHARVVFRPYTVGTVAFAGGAVLLLAVLGSLRRSRLTVIAACLLLCAEGVGAALVPVVSAPRHVVVDTAPVRYLQSHLGLGRFFGFGVVHADYGAYYGIASLDTTDAMLPKAWASEISTQLAPDTQPIHFDGLHVDRGTQTATDEALAALPAYESFGVRYLVAADGTSEPTPVAPGLRKVFDDGRYSIFELPDPTPYFSVVRGGPCTLRADGYDEVSATCAAPALVQRAEQYLTGWSVTVNGQARPLLSDGGLLTDVQLPAGGSVATFSYTPPHLTAALAGFLLGLVGLGGVPLGWRLRRRRGQGAAGPARRKRSASSTPSGVPIS